MIATYDIETKRGVDLSRGFRFKSGETLINLTGKVFVFRAKWRGGGLRKQTGVDTGLIMATPANGELLLTLTKAETRTLPEGRIARYEIEVREPIGTQDVWLEGYLSVSAGINDDA